VEMPGSRALPATQTGGGRQPAGPSAAVIVAAAAASHFVVNGFQSSTTAGVAHDVTVTATDAYGNTDTNYVGSVSITSTDPQAVVPGSAERRAGGVWGGNGGQQLWVRVEVVGAWVRSGWEDTCRGSEG